MLIVDWHAVNMQSAAGLSSRAPKRSIENRLASAPITSFRMREQEEEDKTHSSIDCYYADSPHFPTFTLLFMPFCSAGTTQVRNDTGRFMTPMLREAFHDRNIYCNYVPCLFLLRSLLLSASISSKLSIFPAFPSSSPLHFTIFFCFSSLTFYE